MPGNVPYVSSSAINNGVDDFIGNTEGVRKFNDCMTIANSGSVGKTFFHEYEFIASDHVTAMQAPHMNKYIYLFIATISQRLKEKYSFNREINEARINRERITLPVDDDGNPDWPFMEEYIRERERLLLERYSRSAEGECEKVSLDGVKWGVFAISDVAEIISGRGIFEYDRTSGDIPYITSSAMNNGVSYFLSNTNETLEADCISVNSNGSVGYAFYHPYEALYSGDCRKLRLFHRDKYTALFVATSISHQRKKYNYGYKMGTARLKRQRIQLPIDEFGRPDYSFMEKFMRSLEGRLLRLYVSHLQVKLRNTPPRNYLA